MWSENKVPVLNQHLYSVLGCTQICSHFLNIHLNHAWHYGTTWLNPYQMQQPTSWTSEIQIRLCTLDRTCSNILTNISQKNSKLNPKPKPKTKFKPQLNNTKPVIWCVCLYTPSKMDAILKFCKFIVRHSSPPKFSTPGLQHSSHAKKDHHSLASTIIAILLSSICFAQSPPIFTYIAWPKGEALQEAYRLYMGWQICQTQNCALCTIHIHKGMWHHCVKQAKLILITIRTFSRFYSLLSSFQNVLCHVLSTH
jgi:hypothetical protein